MKSALILALAGSAVAAPTFGDFVASLFGGSSDENRPQPSGFSGLPPFSSGSGVPFPFPTATGAPFPSGTAGAQPFPNPGSDDQEKRDAKALHMDYELAPKLARAIQRRVLKHRQLDDPALPAFSLLDPNETPVATGLPTGLPTELPSGLPTGLPTELPSGLPTGLPTGFPTGIPTDLPGLPSGFPTPSAGGPSAPFPFPTGNAAFPSGELSLPTDIPFPTAPAGTGFPGLPTTFGTLTRGPKPTAAPDAPEQESEATENGNGWLDWVSGLLTGDEDSQN